MVSIKQAVKAAEEALTQLYDTPEGVQLEEVALSDDERYWKITLSFLAPRDAADQTVFEHFSQSLTQSVKKRQYKTFEIDRQTGQFHAMTMRLVPSV